MERVRIKCPNCGAILEVNMQPGIEQKKVKCPVCKELSAFCSYKRIAQQQDSETYYPNSDKSRGGSYGSNAEETEPVGQMNFTIGELILETSSLPPFRLVLGRNVIGRQATTSKAGIQIPTKDSKRMSREHLVIEVKKVPGVGFVHYVSLFKSGVNDTFLNTEKIEYGECLILSDGDKLRLPDATLLFRIPDEEGTML